MPRSRRCSTARSCIRSSPPTWPAGRGGTRAQKNRSQVRGGGAKPYRQKGTGRARAGTIRSPLRVGGGRAFPARPRSFAHKVNRKMYRGAVRCVLSELIREERLVILEEFAVSEPKTRELVAKLDELELYATLIVVENIDRKPQSGVTQPALRGGTGSPHRGSGQPDRPRQRRHDGRRGQNDRVEARLKAARERSSEMQASAMFQERLMNVIVGPHISEKSTIAADANRQVVFKVRTDATRKEIRQAVELLFDVKVDRVTSVNVPGKAKRRGPSRGRRADWKKAYVRLAPGHDIDFMGVE